MYLRNMISMMVAAALLCGAAFAESGYRFARETENPTPLDTYVAQPDENFAYTLIQKHEMKDYTAFMLDMTSQAWMTEAEVSPVVWRHWVSIVRPKKPDTKTALLYIGGGDNTGRAPRGATADVRKISEKTGSVVAHLMMIPNQPLTFAGDGVPRKEDSLIAYGWRQYLLTGEPKWLARLPMTKAAVRAMDAIQEFLASKEGGKTEIDSFVVAGGSKRGWTTWTTGVVDTRVVAVVPMVIDLLNVVPSFQHHWRAYGFWAPAVKDYERMGIMDWTGTKEYDAMLAIVDPYSYRERLTMPKLIMNGSGDQFFLPDSWKFYWDDLKGPKYLRYVPNAGHGLNADAVNSLIAFFDAVSEGKPLPQYAWAFADPETVTVTTLDKPSAVKLWQCTNAEARDFRIDVTGPAWTESPLTPDEKGVYTARVMAPEKGWTASMVELTFDTPSGVPLRYTTPVRVVPETLPFEYVQPKHPEGGFLSNAASN